MKLKYILSLILITIILTDCKKDIVDKSDADFFVSDNSTLTFVKEGETKTISVVASSTDKWYIDKHVQDSWISTKVESNKIHVTALEYDGAGNRSTKLTVCLPKGKLTYTITQLGGDAVLKLDGGERDIFFKKEGNSKVIKFITNSDNWTVKPFEETSWLSYIPSYKENVLTIKVNKFLKTDKGYRSNRKAILYVSNNDKHIQLNITQSGGAQFGMPIYMVSRQRKDIIAAEKKRGHIRDRAYERNFWPEGEDGDKLYMAYSNDGEQTPLSIYYFNRSEQVDKDDLQTASRKVYIKAHENKSFDEEELKAWMEFNKFKEGIPDPASWNRPDFVFYKEDDEKSAKFEVHSKATATLRVGDYKGAYMSYIESGLYLEINESQNYIKTFPVRNAYKLHNLSYKVNEVIAYEATQNMVPDYNHELTQTTSNSTCPYSSLVFVQKNPDASKGKLINVVYAFNRPDVDPNIADQMNLDPKYAGTVGLRQDVYQGKDYAFGSRNGYWGPEDYIKSQTKAAINEKGYVMVRESGNFVTFYRSQDELVDVMATSTWFTVSFYKSKKLVDVINKY